MNGNRGLLHRNMQIITIIGFVIVLAGCSDPIAPVAPQWDTDLYFPVAAQTYTLEELLGKDGSLEILSGDDDLLILRKEFPFQGVAIGDRITLDQNAYYVSKKLGALEYEIPDFVDKDVLVRTVFPDIALGSGTVAAHTSPNDIDIAIDPKEFFKEITFEDGFVTVRIRNDMPVPARFPTPVRLIDKGGNTLASVAVNFTLAPGETRELPKFRLRNVTLKDEMLLRTSVATPGSNGQSVMLESSDGLHLEVGIEQTQIRSAIAYLPSQEVEYDDLVDITNGDGTYIESGTIKTGTLRFNLYNYIPVGADLSIQVDGLLENGAPMQRAVRIEPRTGKSIDFQLKNVAVQPLQGKYLSYKIHIITDEAKNTPVFIQAIDSVSVRGTLYGVIFDDLTGSIAPTNIEIDQTEDILFDYTSRLSGNIEFSEARMWTVLYNQANIPVKTDACSVKGTHTLSGRNSTVNIPDSRIDGAAESKLNLPDGEVVSFLNTFSGDFPDRLQLTGNIILNPEGQPGSVSSGDSVRGSLFVEIPMHLNLEAGEINDTSEVAFDHNTREKMSAINSGYIVIDLENHMPVDMTVEPAILDEDYKVLLEPKPIGGGEFLVNAADVDNSGRTLKSTESFTSLEISGDDFKKFLLSKWVRFRLKMKSPGNGAVLFRSQDYIKIRAYAKMNVHTDIVSK